MTNKQYKLLKASSIINKILEDKTITAEDTFQLIKNANIIRDKNLFEISLNVYKKYLSIRSFKILPRNYQLLQTTINTINSIKVHELITKIPKDKLGTTLAQLYTDIIKKQLKLDTITKIIFISVNIVMKKLGIYILIFNTLVCFIALGIVIYTVSILDWKPCPLCLIQQLCVFCIMVLSLLALAVKNFKNFSTIKLVTIIVIVLGAYIATDQAYMQYFLTDINSNNTACRTVSNNFLLDATKSITGTINSCTGISEQISGVSLAVYSFIFFISLLVINCVNFLVRILRK